MPSDLPPPLRRHVPLWAVAVLCVGALGAGAVVLPMLRLDPVPRVRQAPTLAAPAAPAAMPDRPDDPSDAAPDPRIPRFDLVRQDADGQTIVAGRTAPNVQVDLVVDGVTRGEIRSDAAGQFVAFLTLDRSNAARVLWLVARDAQGDRLASDDTVILAPDAGPLRPVAGAGVGADAGDGPAGAVAGLSVPMPAPGTAAPRGTAAPLSAQSERLGGLAPPDQPKLPSRPDMPDAPQRPGGGLPAAGLPGGQDSPDPAARDGTSVRPLVSDAEGVRVLAPAPLAGAALRVDSVAYGAEGAVVLRGRVDPGAPGGVVRATLSGLPPTEITPAPDGTWTLRLHDVPPGDYRLDVARAAGPGDTGGDTVTLPFRRAAAEDVDAALGGAAARVVTVQPGATLWAIARDRYGDGTRYVQVYDANRGAIADPDLIYPGQIFRLPDAAPR